MILTVYNILYVLLILIISIDGKTFRRVSSRTNMLLMFYSGTGVLLWNFYSGSSESGSGVLIFSSWAHAVLSYLLEICLSLDLNPIFLIFVYENILCTESVLLYYWLLKIQWQQYSQMDALVKHSVICNCPSLSEVAIIHTLLSSVLINNQ